MKVYQYRILIDCGGQLYLKVAERLYWRKFRDLKTLVKEYLSLGEDNGLACAIRFPVGSQEPPEEVALCSDAMGMLPQKTAACLK